MAFGLSHGLMVHVQDLELPPEAVVPEAAAGERAPFSVPTPGTTPQNRWLQKCSMAAEHAAAGDFGSAMRLLERCMGSMLHVLHICWSSTQVEVDLGRCCGLGSRFAAERSRTFRNIAAECRQVGVVNFEPLKPYFLELAAGATATLPLLPGVPPLPVSMDRNWSSDAGATPPTAPALVRTAACSKYPVAADSALRGAADLLAGHHQ